MSTIPLRSAVHRILLPLLLAVVAASSPVAARQRAWDGPHGPFGPALRAALAIHPDWTAASVPDGPPRVYGVSVASGRFLYAATEHGVSRSLDGGATWTRHAVETGNPPVQALAADGPLVWAGTATGIHRSLDAGRTWAPASLGLGRADVRAIVRVRTGTLFAAVQPDGAGCALYRSRSDGQLWTCVDADTAGAPIESLAAGEDGSITVVRDGRTLRTPDEGHTWREPAPPETEPESPARNRGSVDVRLAVRF